MALDLMIWFMVVIIIDDRKKSSSCSSALGKLVVKERRIRWIRVYHYH